MRRYLVLLGGATLLATAPAHADPRISVRPYEANEVVVLHGRPGVETTVAFGDDERIENVAVGDSAGWQVTPNKRADLIFVKPASATAKRSNMTVVTDQRTYLFDLVTAARATPVYMMRFSYPNAPKPRPVALAAATPPPAAVAPSPPEPAAPDPAKFNFAWAAKGDKALEPTRVFDDGRATFLQWDADTPLPAILARDETGLEGPVDFTTRGPFIVVDRVPREIVLRSGKKLTVLTPAPAKAPTPARVAEARP